MKRPLWKILTICSMTIMAGISAQPILAQSTQSPDTVNPDTVDDGTYKTVIVKSSAACEALCKAEADICRGTISIQPDITKPDIQCRLNDGFGANPAFPRIPPEPLILDTALADLNRYRAQKGLSALSLNPYLNAVSQSHAIDRAAAGKISHEGSDGKGHGDRLLTAGYKYSIAAENVASGQKSWEQVFKAWQDSPGHDANLLRDDITEFGVAVSYSPKTAQSVYWVMLVAAPLN
ncbi:MAG: CAP domain-containing protein [Litorimonas sp.]